MNPFKKIAFSLLMALGLLLPSVPQSQAAPESTIDAIVKRGTLRVGFSSFVPWAMQDKQGKYIGFEIDVAQRLADDLGHLLYGYLTQFAHCLDALSYLCDVRLHCLSEVR